MSQLASPFDSILTAAAKLPDSGALQPYTERLNCSPASPKIVLIDISASMQEVAYSGRKIDMLRAAVNRPLRQGELAYVFSGICYGIPSLQAIPDPVGGTALHLAIKTIANKIPRETLIICDGKPDDKEAALEAARDLTGIINTLYIGSEDDLEAVRFMNQLARLGCGASQVCDLSRQSQEVLESSVHALLPPA